MNAASDLLAMRQGHDDAKKGDVYMNFSFRKLLLLIPLALLALIALGFLIVKVRLGPLRHEVLMNPRIYAYRGWQSVGVQVYAGDMVYLRAQGTWLYTPDEYHGPEGHARYPAPSFYPIPGVPGGILIGRIGELGQPFVVGRGGAYPVREPGLLYLRINDDILSDNEGYVGVEVSVVSPEDIE